MRNLRAVFDTIRNGLRALEDPDGGYISDSYEQEVLRGVENATRLLMLEIDSTALVRIQVRDHKGEWEWFEDSYFGRYADRPKHKTLFAAQTFMERLNKAIRAGEYEYSSKPYADEEIRYVRTATIHEVIE